MYNKSRSGFTEERAVNDGGGKAWDRDAGAGWMKGERGAGGKIISGWSHWPWFCQ